MIFFGGFIVLIDWIDNIYNHTNQNIFYSYCKIYMAQNEWPDLEILQQGAVLGLLK